MRNTKKQQPTQPEYPLQPSEIIALKDTVDWSEFLYKPHPAQKDFITFKVWDYVHQENFAKTLLSLATLMNTLACKMEDQDIPEDRTVTRHDLSHIAALLMLLLELDQNYCLPKY
jgi:hypothetical protein